MHKRHLEELKAYNHLISEMGTLCHEAAVQSGVSDSVHNILYTIITFDSECTQSNISQLTGIPRQTINSAIRKLEKDGILYLEEENRKNKIIRLTEKGHQFANKTVMPVVNAECAVLSSWSEEDREMLFRLTRRYLEDFRRNLIKETEK